MKQVKAAIAILVADLALGILCAKFKVPEPLFWLLMALAVPVGWRAMSHAETQDELAEAEMKARIAELDGETQTQ